MWYQFVIIFSPDQTIIICCCCCYTWTAGTDWFVCCHVNKKFPLNIWYMHNHNPNLTQELVLHSQINFVINQLNSSSTHYHSAILTLTYFNFQQQKVCDRWSIVLTIQLSCLFIVMWMMSCGVIDEHFRSFQVIIWK